MKKKITEIWKDICGYEGYYQVSSLGQIKTLERTILNEKGKIITRVYERIKKLQFSHKGYHTVNLSKNGSKKTYKVHRLVAINFIPNPKNKEQVNHIDHNKLNNSVENLEWVTNRENCCHAKKRMKYSSQYIGVHFEKRTNKWRTDIRYEGKNITLGRFKTEEDAYQAKKRFELEKGIENKYS